METQLLSPITQSTTQTAMAGRSLLDRVGIILPTFNAERYWSQLQPSLEMQGVSPDRVLVLDSSSADRTVALAEAAGYRVVSIPHEQFNHGGTRQLATSYLPDAELLLYITQDVVFASPDSVQRLCRSLEDATVGAAYGRQLPREQAGPIERHARLFNYPETSHVRSLEDRRTLGIRAAFLSNSFAVYRRSALEAVGGFPAKVISGEDFYTAVSLLMEGWKIAYKADAAVFHSHPLTLKQEFKRYFDIGAQHAREVWMLEAFGRAGSEGRKFVQSEMRYLNAHSRRNIPYATVRTASKLIAYRLGFASHKLPQALIRKFATNPKLWE